METAITAADRHCQLLEAIEEAHERALSLITDPDAATLDGVVWLCVHLSAVQQVVHPVLTRLLGEAAVEPLRDGAVHIERTLRTLEQMAGGDALVANVDGARVVRSLIRQVTNQAQCEHRLWANWPTHWSNA